MIPSALLYNLEGDAGAPLRALCGKLGILWKDVAPADYGRPLGELAGLTGDPAPAASGAAIRAPFREPMLVMVNLLRPQFDALLAGMREQGISIPLKAVLTPTSVRWDSYQLHDELAREDEAMRQRT